MFQCISLTLKGIRCKNRICYGELCKKHKFQPLIQPKKINTAMEINRIKMFSSTLGNIIKLENLFLINF